MIKIILVSIVSILILLFIINLFQNKKIRTEIIVDASVQDVWTVLMNHENYPEWNPFIKNISGTAELNSTLDVTIKMKDKSIMNMAPKVLVNNPNQEFRWLGKLIVNGVFDGEHYFILEKIDENKTRFIHGENFKGILSGLFMTMIRKDTENGFKSMNSALKNRVEND